MDTLCEVEHAMTGTPDAGRRQFALVPSAVGQDDLIDAGAKLDFASEKRFQLPSLSRLAVQNPYAARYQLPTRHRSCRSPA
jgi:hypothetical protein